MNKSNEQITSIDELGSLLSYIFKYLTIPERWIASQVCKRWSHIDRNSLNYVKTLDTSDPSFWYIFGMHICKNKYLMNLNDILQKYGAHVKYLKYWNKKFSRFQPAFPLEILIKTCKNLENVLLLENASTPSITKLANEHENLVEFRLRNLDVAFCPKEISVLFRNNKKLEHIELQINENGFQCLEELRGKPIKELVITVGSKVVLDHLIMVLENLSTITHLGINILIVIDCSDLIKRIGECKNLEKLIFRQKSIPENFLSILSQLDNLMALDISNNCIITDDFISDLASQLVQITALNINGCSQITDRGLTVLAELPNLTELHMHELNITGEGLLEYKNLKFIFCEFCPIFDVFLCQVLNSCRDLEWLNIKHCSNITLATLEMAMRVTADRDNTIMLKINLNFELAFHNKIKIPPLLELYCQKYSSLTSDDLRCMISGINIGEQRFFLQNPVIFANNIYSDDVNVPPLEEKILRRILSYLSIPKRIQMSRVSKTWGMLIDGLWSTVEMLDLTDTEWNYHLSTKPLEEMESIFDKTLTKFGKYVKNLKIHHAKGLERIEFHCPSLETILGSATISSMLTDIFTKNYHETLTKIQILTIANNDRDLGLIFQFNRNLKFISLIAGEGVTYSCLLDLNPHVVETLNLYNVHFPNDDETVKDNFVKAFHRLVNLKSLQIIGTDANLKVILDGITRCTNLKNLKITHKIAMSSSETLEPLLVLENIQVIRLTGYQQLTDNFLEQLRLRIPLITDIDISGSRQVTDEGVRIIAQLSNLKRLIMEALIYIQGTGLSQLSGNNFQQLNCRSCLTIKSSAICDVMKNCPNLRLLNISCCPQLDGAVIDTAFEVAERRSNGYSLRLITDSRLSRVKRPITPDLLELLMIEKLLTDEV